MCIDIVIYVNNVSNMETFGSDIIKNICLNHEHEIVKDITEGLEVLVNRFVKEMTSRFPDFKVKCVTRCGSMAEKTRIKGSQGLEYDYIIEMESWPNCGELYFRPSCEGSMQPLYVVANEDYVSLKTCVLTIFFYNFIHKSIEKCCKNSFCPKFASNDSQEFVKYKTFNSFSNETSLCPKCSVFMNTGYLTYYGFNAKFQFHWIPKHPISFVTVTVSDVSRISPFPINYDHLYLDKLSIVSVDIHPVLIVTPEKILHYNSEIERSSEGNVYCYLFPNCRTNHTKSCDRGEACWRISHYKTELQMLQQTNQGHRNMYMILKFIREELFQDERGLRGVLRVGSYEVKTAVLRHIKYCNIPKNNVEKCLIDTINFLAKCFKEKNLKHVVSGVNIFKLNTEYDRIFTSYETIGLIFQALYDILTTAKDTRTAELLQDLEMIRAHVATVFFKTDNPYVQNMYNKSLAYLDETKIQTCQDALKEYVNERTVKTASSILYKYVMKKTRYNRLCQLQLLNLYHDERIKRKIDEEMTQLRNCDIYFGNMHKSVIYHGNRIQPISSLYLGGVSEVNVSRYPKMLTGCYI